MKNFLLFCGHNTSKRGGMSDFVESFDSCYLAKKFIEDENTLHNLLDTLPSIQWAHVYSVEEKRIIEKGTIEIWDRNDIGNADDDPSTVFQWVPTDDEKDLQPLLVQSQKEKAVKEQKEQEEAQKAAQEENETQELQKDLDKLQQHHYKFDLGKFDPVLDEIFVHMDVAYDITSMEQENEITTRHMHILQYTFDEDDKIYIENMNGPGGPNHWIKQVQKYYKDLDVLKEFFVTEIMTSEEVNSFK